MTSSKLRSSIPKCLNARAVGALGNVTDERCRASHREHRHPPVDSISDSTSDSQPSDSVFENKRFTSTQISFQKPSASMYLARAEESCFGVTLGNAMCPRSFALLLLLIFMPLGQVLAQEVVTPGIAPSVGVNQKAEPAQNGKRSTTYRYWTTEWSFREIDLKTLTKRLKLIGIELPVSVSGTADVEFDVSVPWNALGTGSAYRIEGTIQAKNLAADAAALESFQAQVKFDKGVLGLKELRVVQGAGKVAGELRMQLTPPGNFNGTLQVSGIDIAPVTTVMQKFGIGSASRPVRGLLGGDVSVSGAVNDLTDPLRWTVAGTLGIDQLAVADSLRYTAKLTGFQLKDQAASWKHLRATSINRPAFFVNAKGAVSLTPGGNYRIDLAANDLPVGDLAAMALDSAAESVQGKLDLKGQLHGELGNDDQLASVNLTASIASPAMKVAGVELGLLEHDLVIRDQQITLRPRGDGGSIGLPINELTARYEIGKQSLSLADISARLFGGAFKGDLSLSRTDEGQHSLNATWDQLSPKISLPSALGKLQVSSETSGSIKWKVTASEVASPIAHDLDAQVEVAELNVGAQPFGRLMLDLKLADGRLIADAKGRLMGGDVTAKTVSRISDQTRWQEIPQSLLGELVFTNVSLARVARRLYGKRTRFDGQLSGNLQWQSRPGQPLETKFKIKLLRLESGAVLISRGIQIDASTNGPKLSVRSIHGNYAGGQVDASGSWSLDGGQRLLTARIVRADGDRMLIPVSEDATAWVGGSVSATAQITGGGKGPFDVLKVSGALDVDQATTFGLPVGKAHSPYRVRVETKTLRWSADFPTVRSSLARGQVSGKLHFSSAGSNRAGFNMDSRWRVNHVDFEQLLSTYVGASTIGHGNVTGDLSLGGRSIRGARDLKGLFRMNLGGTDASAVPGLSTSGSLLGAASLAGVRFSEGEVSGRIARDSIMIDTLLMTSDRAAFQATGRIAISDQRLDIEATLATGNFEGQNLLLGQIGRLSLVDFLPLGQVNRLLSDRIVVFEMIGPPRAPIIRLLPAKTLQANTKRFAVQEVAGVIAIDSLLMD